MPSYTDVKPQFSALVSHNYTAKQQQPHGYGNIVLDLAKLKNAANTN